MSDAFLEFADANLHRSYPLTDDSSGKDQLNAFVIPSALISDIYLCAPNLPFVDCDQFYIMDILIRQAYIDITIGYNGLAQPLGVFKNIRMDGDLHDAYSFIPSEIQTNDQYAPLYAMTGQITIGRPESARPYLGQWVFAYADAKITATRVSKGLRNVQYISINGRLFSGHVQLREGSNVSLDVAEQVIGGESVTVITVNARVADTPDTQLTSDSDVLNALVALYGRPILTINGMYPDASRNFLIEGGDCSQVSTNAAGLVLGNPCATPCCDTDAAIEALLDSVANLNQRYAQLKTSQDGQASDINLLQQRVLGLTTET